MRTVINYPVWWSKEKIPQDVCEEIIRIGKELKLEEGTVVGTAGQHKRKDPTYRETNIAWFEKGHTLDSLIQSYVGLANLEAKWNFTITGMERIQFGEYKRKGFYDWHRDTITNVKLPNRKLSVSVNLSNPKDYEGGDLIIKNYYGTRELKLVENLRPQGTVVVFPSILQHKVTPVKRGTRYSLVQWYNGPEFT